MISESRLKLIFESAPVGIVQLDGKRRYISANPAFEKFIGYSLAELRQMTMFEVTHPEDLAETKQASEKISRGDHTLRRLEKRYITKDKSTVWGRVSSRQVEDPETKELHLFTVIEDITLQKRQQLELQRAEAEIAHFFASSIDLMCVAGMDGKFRRVNAAFSEVLGFTAEELLTSPIVEFIHPEDQAATARELEDLASGKTTLNFENRYRTKSGSYRVISWKATPDASREFIYATGRDITEARLTEIKLAYSSKMASLGEMAGGIAHEINNPLAIILGKATTLKILLGQQRVDLEHIAEELSSIERTGQRIAKIIRGLRAFSRHGDADPFSRVPLFRVIEDTLELCAERLKNKSIDLYVNCPRDLAISCRPSQLSQVIMNLLSNSYDAIEKLEKPWIRIEAREDEDKVLLHIEDSGNGISPAVQEKMMQPFFTTKEVGRGTGLGLSISKGIVEEHGGQLRYDGNSANTRFVVEIPSARPFF